MAIKFQTNVRVPLCFPYGDFKEVEGQYGKQFLYTVEIDGGRDWLYATPALHEYLQNAGITPGVNINVTKIELEGNKRGWQVEPVVAEIEPDPENPMGDIVVTPGIEELARLMKVSMTSSLIMWTNLDEEVVFSSEDIRAVAISLFIEGARRGLSPEPFMAGEEIQATNGSL